MMKRIWIVGLMVAAPVLAAEPADLRETSAVIEALKTRYVDREKLDTKLLNDATVAGLLQALGQGAVIITPAPLGAGQAMATNAATTPAVAEPLARAEVIDPAIGYLRLADVVAATVPAIDGELKKFSAEKVEGYVLDLRFADGTNYAAAAAVAGRFLADGQPVFAVKTATGIGAAFRASRPPAEIAPGLTTVPLMVLVNGATRGGAEAVAAALQAQQRGIVMGAPTTGAAVAWEDVPLGAGRVLRVATAKVVFGTGAGAMTASVFPNGITPDIPVKIDPLVERDVILHAATNVTLTASLQPRSKKKGLSEADLVKVFRGETIETSKPAPATAPDETGSKDSGDEIQPVKDVVLQRAVDILKGIRSLVSWRGSAGAE